MEHDYLITESGFMKPLALLKMDDKNSLIHTAALHHVLLHAKGELDQFVEGLRALGVQKALEEYPSIMKPFFTPKGIVPLTAGMLASFPGHVFECLHGNVATGMYSDLSHQLESQ